VSLDAREGLAPPVPSRSAVDAGEAVTLPSGPRRAGVL
jgi:hypothetical protein